MKMKPFTKYPVCPKCGCGEQPKGTPWRSATGGVVPLLLQPPLGERQFLKHCPRKAKQPEHLQVECSRCGFKWKIRTKA